MQIIIDIDDTTKQIDTKTSEPLSPLYMIDLFAKLIIEARKLIIVKEPVNKIITPEKKVVSWFIIVKDVFTILIL